MPTTLVNSNLESLNAGVTQQYQQARYDSQVEKMINCIPSLTKGVVRRNPVLPVKELEGLPADLTDSFVYTYDRGTGTAQYISVYPGNGYMYIYNINDGVLKYTSPYSSYLLMPTGTPARFNFKALTIGDYTFILNTTITTKYTTDTTGGYEALFNKAFYWIKKTTSTVKSQTQTDISATSDGSEIYSGSLMEGYEYSINGVTVKGIEDTRAINSDNHVFENTGHTIAEKIAGNTNTKLDAHYESFAYNVDYPRTSMQWDDTFSSEASLGVYDVIEDQEMLPSILPPDLDDFMVRVTGGSGAETDDYWLQYNVADAGWSEVPDANVFFKLDASTMPHVVYRFNDDDFTFDTYQGINSTGDGVDGISLWGDKVAGSADLLDQPSFIGRPLKDILFYKNRLGFITGDSIILSQTSVFGNFFPQSKQEVLDDDVIDLSVASTEVTVLRRAVSTSGQLILFADDTQFVLESTSGSLTPTTADITALSNYTYNQYAPAMSIGNKVYFSNKAGGYSQMYSYRVTEQGSKLTEADPMTLHLPTYIDSSISKIIGHDVLGQIFIEEFNYPNTLTVLNTVQKNGETLQNAFHRWVFDKDLVSSNIVNNDLYLLFSDGSLCKMVLELPGDIESVTYGDQYTVGGEMIEYQSGVEFSQFFLRDDQGKGTLRGRYQLRSIKFTVDDESKYITTIYNRDQELLSEGTYGPEWVDTDNWDDTLNWLDFNPLYSREYVNDDKISIMSNSQRVYLAFTHNKYDPYRGFALATANVEAQFTQRSNRR